jgi:hypothetical protein
MKFFKATGMKHKRVIILFLLLISGALPLTAQNTLTILTVAPDISPFLADWREDATALFVRIENVGGNEVPRAIVKLVITGIKSGQVVEAKSKEFKIPANGSVTLYGNDKLLDAKSITFQGNVLSKVQASNRIPDDHYDICCDVIELPSERTIANNCAAFDIRSASPPMLISPPDGEVVMTKYPFFQWMPSRTTNKIEARYTVTVRPLRDFQTPEQSLASGTVKIFDKADLTIPNAQMTSEALELEDGKTYVWQVQARDRARHPLGENDGKSEVFKFTYMTPESMHSQQAKKDSLGTAVDTVKTK